MAEFWELVKFLFLSCLFKLSLTPPLGLVPGVIGCLQALEAVKIITDKGDPLSSRLLLYSAMDAHFRNVRLRRRSPQCQVCGDTPSIRELIDYEQFCHSAANDRPEVLKFCATFSFHQRHLPLRIEASIF